MERYNKTYTHAGTYCGVGMAAYFQEETLKYTRTNTHARTHTHTFNNEKERKANICTTPVLTHTHASAQEG